MSTQDIAVRYKRSIIGPFWISLSIAFFVLGLAFVYAELFRAPFQEYLNRLATGYVMWHYIAAMINDGSHSVTEASSSLKSIRLPTSVLATRVVSRNIIILLHNLVAVIPIMMLVGGHQFNAELIWLLPGLVTYAVLGIFVGITLGPLSARFRDVPEVLKSVTQLCFFITPVIWPADRISADSALVAYNPFYHLIELLRAPLLGSAPTSENWVAAGICLAFFFATSLISVHAARQRLPLWV